MESLQCNATIDGRTLNVHRREYESIIFTIEVNYGRNVKTVILRDIITWESFLRSICFYIRPEGETEFDANIYDAVAQEFCNAYGGYVEIFQDSWESFEDFVLRFKNTLERQYGTYGDFYIKTSIGQLMLIGSIEEI